MVHRDLLLASTLPLPPGRGFSSWRLWISHSRTSISISEDRMGEATCGRRGRVELAIPPSGSEGACAQADSELASWPSLSLRSQTQAAPGCGEPEFQPNSEPESESEEPYPQR